MDDLAEVIDTVFINYIQSYVWFDEREKRQFQFTFAIWNSKIYLIFKNSTKRKKDMIKIQKIEKIIFFSEINITRKR